MNNDRQNKTGNRSNQNKTVTILTITSIILAFALLLVSALAAYLIINMPLGEKMTIVKQPTAAPTAVAAEGSKVINIPKPQGTCGNTGSMLVLLTGADFTMGNPPYGADAIRLIKVDYDNQKVTAVAFPRDLLVNTPALSDLNIAETTLGQAYYFRRVDSPSGAKPAITKATEALAQTIYDNFTYPTDKKGYYYLTLQLDEIGSMIDTIGGVDITLPESITTERGVVFPAGPQVLDGIQSAEFLRAIQPGGDAARLQRQNLYAKALQNKLLSFSILAKVPELYKRFDKAVVTDLSPKQIEALACMSEKVPQDKITFHEIGYDLVTPTGTEILLPNVDKIKVKLMEWLDN